MQTLAINLRHCYGIKHLAHEFDLSPTAGKRNKPAARAYAIYAPNGVMKTSFARSFARFAEGKEPVEERFGHQTEAVVKLDGEPVKVEQIYVLPAGVDLQLNTKAVTTLLVNQQQKAAYDALVAELNEQKDRLLSVLQKASGVKKAGVEHTLTADFPESANFVSAVRQAMAMAPSDDLSAFKYSDIFDPKALAVLEDPSFQAQAKDFAQRYRTLFEQAGTIYQKGVFNPIKAETAFSTLEKQGYFATGHKVHLAGEAESLDLDALNMRMQEVNKQIEGDERLKQIQDNLAKNAQAKAIAAFIEEQSASVVELLLDAIQPGNQRQFKQALWAYYLKNTSLAETLLQTHASHATQIGQIEQQAATESPRWQRAIGLFNQRFINMPYSLSVQNPAKATLGEEPAWLVCEFKDGLDRKSVPVADMPNCLLSQGEQRAFYLLNFIFEVEQRKLEQQPTLFVLDDPADSFDYKNKHAILQYLQDLTRVEHFAQIILTHNFDLFRSLANSFVRYSRCLMANRTGAGITLEQVRGINNIFIGEWKDKFFDNDTILCACIPFVRNLIEYINGADTDDYNTLTSLLHWKQDTANITVGQFKQIYQRMFGDDGQPTDDDRLMPDLLFHQADEITAVTAQPGLNLENKVVLSIAIRLKAEQYMTEALREKLQQPGYWCTANRSQFGKLINEYSEHCSDSAAINVLEQVSITVSSNIHLNSFMYEPILDLSQGHLVALYQQVTQLAPQ